VSRFNKEDWLSLGADLLGKEGPDALTLERLTKAAGRTRGSFYHHFANREAFLTGLMDWWRQRAIDSLAARIQAAPGPETLRSILRAVPSEWDAAFERGIRRLAVSEPVVKDALINIDETRIAGLAATIALLRPDVEDPRSLAFIQYAAVIGGQWLLESPDDPRIPAIKLAGDALFGLLD
jgi:AcrR family transcriptional regulator